MTLKEFFRLNPFITKRQLAQKIDTDTATLFCIVKGRTPSLKHAVAIEEATDGQVTCRDLYRNSIKTKKGEK
jgi:DNA-binding transcriptional regulator YdaS (Cro superfamily)